MKRRGTQKWTGTRLRMTWAVLIACALALVPAAGAQATDAGVTVTAPTLEQPQAEGEPASVLPPADADDADAPQEQEADETAGQASPDEQASRAGPEADPGQDAPGFDVEARAGGLLVTVGPVQGIAGVELALAEGVKPAPGVYARGSGLVAAWSETTDGRVIVHLSMDCDDGTAQAWLATQGLSPAGTIVDLARAWDAEGSLIAELEPACTGGAAGADDVATLAQSASEPFRTDGYFSNTSSPTEHQIPTLSNARTGAAAFCNDMFMDAPGDPQHGSSEPVWYRSWQFPSDPQAAAEQGQNYLDFILFWGYPTDPTVGGRCSEEDGRAATQWALWNFTNPGSHPTWEAPSESWSAGFWHAYDWLVEAAMDYNERCLAQGAASQPEHGTCLVWEVGDAALQSILTASPNWGWIRLEKASTRPELLDGSTYALAGATFEVRGSDGAVVAALETDAQGAAEALVPVGTYTLAETRAPAGHGICAEVSVQVTGGPVGVLVPMTDPALLGSVTVTKHAASDEGPAMAGARFAVLDADENVAATLVTGTDGRASTADDSLPLGTYVLRELEAPDGFSLAADVTFEVTAARSRVEVSVTDPYDTTVIVSKLAKDTGQDLSGAHLQVLGPSGNVVDDWVSDGAPHEMRGLAPGTYVLREAEAPAGYAVAADVTFNVALTSKSQVVSMIDGRRRVPLAFTKADALTGAPLAGAEFLLLRPTRGLPDEVGQEQLADANLWEEAGSACSDGQGVVDFGELDEGEYLLLEAKAPDGYQRPTGGWLLACDAASGVSCSSVGDVPPASLSPTAEGLVLPNARAGELPHAGGRGPGPAAGVGTALAAAGVLAGTRALRRHPTTEARG